MASSNVIDGIIKWLQRDEWQEPFGELLGRHLSAACERIDGSPDDLLRLIGQERGDAVWPCIMEDFFAFDGEDGRNIVDDYLAKRGSRESAANKRYLAAVRASVMSVYEVSEVVPGQSLLLNDLLRGGPPVRVSEKTASRTLKQWDRLAARLVPLGSKVELTGGLLPLTHTQGDLLQDGFADHRRGMHEELRDAGGPQPDEPGGDDYALDTGILRHSAFMFTALWLDSILDVLLDGKQPRIANTDGDELVPTTVRYPLVEGCDRTALVAALTAMPDLVRAGDSLWNWYEPAEDEPAPDAPAWPDGATLLGDVLLQADALRLETNSLERAEEGHALLAEAVAPFVGEPSVTTQTAVVEGTGAADDEAEVNATDLSPEEHRAVVHQAMERYYRDLLDQPVPMLGDRSPREAAQTPDGRRALVGWLKFMENTSAKTADLSVIGSYDFGWMWHELGIADLRR